MNKSILKTGVQNFIKNNWNTDTLSVLLKKQQFEGVSQKELVEQLEAKKKSATKLPLWFATERIYYPNKLNIEQTSSEQTAKYKASLVQGKTLLDVTGGFGVDSYFFSKQLDAIFHCESNVQLSQITSHNFEVLGVKNTTFYTGNGIGFIKETNVNFDWIFADPSRRNDVKGKVFLLNDCLPNIPEALDTIFEKTENVLIKTSPLLDIKQGITELKFVKEVHVVAIKNEVKELLWVLKKNYAEEVQLKTVNLLKEKNQVFDFALLEEKNTTPEFALPGKYLYEPNASILKSGGFKCVGTAFGLKKLHEHSHLYTSESLVDFPGRSFLVLKPHSYNKKELKKLQLKKANITTRNFPETVASIRKKLKIVDGGDDYLFFTTNYLGVLMVLHCKKI